MGFVIFEQSGTFIPSNYGLVTGDPIQVVVVGGGGGGTHPYQGATTSTGGNYTIRYSGGDATAGGTSSFGSYFSAAGGAVGGGKRSPRTPAIQVPLFATAGSGSNMSVSLAQYYCNSGGQGDDGWLPGVEAFTPDASQIFADILMGKGILTTPNSFMRQYCGVPVYIRYGSGTVGAGSVSQHTDKQGGSAYIQYPTASSQSGLVFYMAGPGGLGYGAGGGGLCNCCYDTTYISGGSYKTQNSTASSSGGSAGQVVTGAMLLQRTSNIPVTVGTGGRGCDKFKHGSSSITFTSYTQPGHSGGGASGCVAVFW